MVGAFPLKFEVKGALESTNFCSALNRNNKLTENFEILQPSSWLCHKWQSSREKLNLSSWRVTGISYSSHGMTNYEKFSPLGFLKEIKLNFAKYK
jgi:hypothetical protein